MRLEVRLGGGHYDETLELEGETYTARSNSSREQTPTCGITGASSGIGHGLMQVLAENGYDLTVCSQRDGIGLVNPEIEKHGAEGDGGQISSRSDRRGRLPTNVGTG